MAQVEEMFLAENIEIVWVLEEDTSFNPGTAMSCRNWVNSRGSDKGWCVGDGQTMPNAGTWDASPFAIGRGFDILVDRNTMEILYETSHGTPAGNENLTGEELLAEVRLVLGR